MAAFQSESMLFDKKTLSSIMRNPQIHGKYKDYLLYNKDDMLRYIANSIFFREKDVYCMDKDNCEQKVKHEQGPYIQKILSMVQDMCKRMSHEYITSMFNESFKDNSGYEILFIIKRTNPDKKTRRLGKTTDLSTMEGFLIAKKGECRRYPWQYMVEIICTKVRGISSFLLGACLLTIKKKSTLEDSTVGYKVMLKSMDGFENPAAYCGYRKMGFSLDPDIYVTTPNGIRCTTKEPQNLPMTLDTFSIEFDDIVHHMVHTSSKKDPICDRRFASDALVDGGSERLRKLREKIVLLYEVDYKLRLGFAQRDLAQNYHQKHYTSPYNQDFQFLTKKYSDLSMGYIYYDTFAEIVEHAIRDDSLKDDVSAQDLLSSLRKILGYQNAQSYPKIKNDLFVFEFSGDGDRFNMEDYNKFKEELTRFHGMYKKPLNGQPESNCLLVKIEEKIQLLFGEYLEEYSRLKPSRSRSKSRSSQKSKVSLRNSPKTPDGSPPPLLLPPPPPPKKGKVSAHNSPKTPDGSPPPSKKGGVSLRPRSGGKRKPARKTKRAKKQSKRKSTKNRRYIDGESNPKARRQTHHHHFLHRV